MIIVVVQFEMNIHNVFFFVNNCELVELIIINHSGILEDAEFLFIII